MRTFQPLTNGDGIGHNFDQYKGGAIAMNYIYRSLAGCPRTVTGGFSCTNNSRLETLDGGPSIVQGDYDCSYCEKLSSLSGCASHVGADFNCSNTDIDSFEHCPQYVGGRMFIRNTKIREFRHVPKSVRSMVVCQVTNILMLTATGCRDVLVLDPAVAIGSLNSELARIPNPKLGIFRNKLNLVQAGYARFAKI